LQTASGKKDFTINRGKEKVVEEIPMGLDSMPRVQPAIGKIRAFSCRIIVLSVLGTR